VRNVGYRFVLTPPRTDESIPEPVPAPVG